MFSCRIFISFWKESFDKVSGSLTLFYLIMDKKIYGNFRLENDYVLHLILEVIFDITIETSMLISLDGGFPYACDLLESELENPKLM